MKAWMRQTTSFLVAPWIGVQSIRYWLDDPVRQSVLRKNHLTPAILLRNLLDSLQLPEVRGEVQLGYTIGISVFDLFTRDAAGNWEFDETKLEFFTDLFLAVGRPVVVHLRANHFVGESLLARELVEDESSCARTNDGSTIRESYYGNAVFAPTFSLDEAIPLNRYRFTGLSRIASRLAAFDRQHPGLIYACTLAGEVHHFMPDLANPLTAGRFENVQMTDYSEASIRDFRRWLQTRHATVSELNERFGTGFPSWDDVQPPRCDLRDDPVSPLWMHMDSYANGVLPVFGWAELPPGATVQIYLDGERAGEAEYGFSRLDVYEALERLNDSDVGFRFDLDFRGLAQGQHTIHAVIELRSGMRYLIDQRTVVVGRNGAAGGCSQTPFDALDTLPPSCNESLRFGWLDHPPQGLSLVFNPYAAEWQEFREFQVYSLIAKFAQLAMEAGLPRQKVYSHHIMPHFEGSWNQVAFALPVRTVENDAAMPGLTLYGGATVYRNIERVTKGRRYGIPEFHPRMGRPASKGIFRRSLEYHRRLGAAFLCPYYMILREFPGVSMDEVSGLLISPLNPSFGSLFFYSELLAFLDSR